MLNLAALIERYDLSPSDVVLLYCGLAAALFFVIYTITAAWWRVKKFGWLGVVTALHSFSIMCLLFLIIYAIILGQKVDEGYRLAVSIAVAVALTSKTAVYVYERVRGVKERHDERVRLAGLLGHERVRDGS